MLSASSLKRLTWAGQSLGLVHVLSLTVFAALQPIRSPKKSRKYDKEKEGKKKFCVSTGTCFSVSVCVCV